MTHKADARFFANKREWSKRKDEILGCYLCAYLPKIMMLKKPVLIIDGFAGPGKFEDGECGSPLIICDSIQKTLAKTLQSPQPAKLVCIEKTPELFADLEANLKSFDFAIAREGSFSDFAEEISNAAKSKSVFLYVDPFTVEGLNWSELDRIFEGLDFGNSIEILLNLNSVSFLRRGLAALKTQLHKMDDEDDEPVDAEFMEDPQIETLDSVAGGSWWQKLVERQLDFPETVNEFTCEFCERMKTRFNEVVFHPIKALPHHTVPKYFLVFGTRHIDGLALMNDEMVKSRRALADMAKPREATLFETRSEELVPDLDRLPDLIIKFAQRPAKRKDVINKIVQQAFCDFHRSEIRGCIETLLSAGTLKSESGRVRINDEEIIWTS